MEIPEKDVKLITGKLSPNKEEASILLKQADSYVIKSAQDVDSASGFLRKIKDVENRVEAKRLEFTKPLNESLKAINNTFRQVSETLSQARKLLTEKILSWRRQEQEKIAKEEERRRKIQEAHERAGHEVKAPIILERPETRIGDTQVRKIWNWEIVDFSKVPDIYKEINRVAINLVIRNGIREISGLNIFQEEALSIVRR